MDLTPFLTKLHAEMEAAFGTPEVLRTWFKRHVPDENEFNADVQWRPNWSFLNGFSARFRYSWVKQYQGPKDHQDDFRFIINYDFPLL